MKVAKRITDCAMIILLPLLMSYSLLSEKLHEWLGIAMFAVFIVHHILNRKWFTTLFKGSYPPFRIYTTVIDVLLLIIMFALPVSGILMSRYAVPALSIKNGASIARTVHMTTAYWGFVLMSLHLGCHSQMMMAGMKKMFGLKGKSSARTAVLRVIAALIGAYGICAFIKRKLLSYMFMQMMFAFFDFSESRIVFYTDYISIMLMLAIASHYICILLRKSGGSKKPED